MARSALTDPERIDELLQEMGVRGYSLDVTASLAALAKGEEAAAKASAAAYATQLGRRAVDVDCMRLACETRQLQQPPLRAQTLDAARFQNAQGVAWPLGPAMRVPLVSAAGHRVDTVLRENSSSSRNESPAGAASASHPAAGGGFAIAAGSKHQPFMLPAGQLQSQRQTKQRLDDGTFDS